MKITEVEIYNVTWDKNPKPVIVRIHTDEGISGVGEVGLAYGALGAGWWTGGLRCDEWYR